MLRTIEERAKEQDVKILTARIRKSNAASVAAFKRAGYYAFVEQLVDGETWVACERRVVPFPK